MSTDAGSGDAENAALECVNTVASKSDVDCAMAVSTDAAKAGAESARKAANNIFLALKESMDIPVLRRLPLPEECRRIVEKFAFEPHPLALLVKKNGFSLPL